MRGMAAEGIVLASRRSLACVETKQRSRLSYGGRPVLRETRSIPAWSKNTASSRGRMTANGKTKAEAGGPFYQHSLSPHKRRDEKKEMGCVPRLPSCGQAGSETLPPDAGPMFPTCQHRRVASVDLTPASHETAETAASPSNASGRRQWPWKPPCRGQMTVGRRRVCVIGARATRARRRPGPLVGRLDIFDAARS